MCVCVRVYACMCVREDRRSHRQRPRQKERVSERRAEGEGGRGGGKTRGVIRKQRLHEFSHSIITTLHTHTVQLVNTVA